MKVIYEDYNKGFEKTSDRLRKYTIKTRAKIPGYDKRRFRITQWKEHKDKLAIPTARP
jgi:hypothetical protein